MKQLHRLVEARVNLHFLPELYALEEPVGEPTHGVAPPSRTVGVTDPSFGRSYRTRIRVVSAGPR